MNSSNIDYDSVAELYDLYVTATYDFEFFLAEAAKAEGPALELTAGTGRLSLPLLEVRQRQALAAVHSALLPGGRFICTMHNPAVRRKTVDGALRLVGRFSAPEGSLVVSGFEQGGSPVVQRLQFFETFGPSGELLAKRMLPMEFAFIEKENFDAMARGAGFRVTALYGGYDRSPFDPVSSPVMIWVLEKDPA
jgi:hypothetical protein